MSLLKQNTTKKGQVDDNITELIELDANNNESGEYKVEAIYNSAVYAKKLESGHLPKLDYLVF